MEEVVYSTVLQAVYCTQYAFYAHQIWSSQGHDHVLGLGFQVLCPGLGLPVLGLVLGSGP